MIYHVLVTAKRFGLFQASTILYAFAYHKDKLKALEMMEPVSATNFSSAASSH